MSWLEAKFPECLFKRCLNCRALQHIAIRKQEDELHAAVEAGLPDEEIGKLARIAHRVSALSIATNLTSVQRRLRQTCKDSLQVT